MISKKVVMAVCKTASETNKNEVINEIIKHVSLNYDYSDLKQQHILEMLVDNNSIVTLEDIDVNLIKENPDNIIYNSEKYEFSNIVVDSVDNIDCIVKIRYKYVNKEDTTKTVYDGYTNISFIDNPKIIKNS